MQQFIRSALAAICAAAVVSSAAVAAGTGSQGQEATAKECSDCHMVYPARLLPQRSWQAVMGDLANHFGGDASLDEATRADIETYLVANAADAGGRRSGVMRGVGKNEVPLRISELPWFKSEHGSRSRQRAKNDPRIKTISSCTGCHRGAERGNFDDD